MRFLMKASITSKLYITCAFKGALCSILTELEMAHIWYVTPLLLKMLHTALLKWTLTRFVWILGTIWVVGSHLFFFCAGLSWHRGLSHSYTCCMQVAPYISFSVLLCIFVFRSYPVFYVLTLKDSSLIPLFSAPYGPSLFPYLSKYSDHDITHTVQLFHIL